MHQHSVCEPKDVVTEFLPVMVYIQSQKLESVFEPESALIHGTLFPEILKPFKGGCKNG